MKSNFHPAIIIGIFIGLFIQIPGSSFAQQKQGPDLPGPLHLGPSCQFSVLNYCYGDTTYFINQTIRMMKPRWEIADTSGIIFSSDSTHIEFLFPARGTYSVTVRADNGHPDSLTKIIVIDTTTKADFTFQQCSQQFINMSSCATGFYWDFGDSSYSTDPTPVHLYADTGSYAVSLIASNGTVSDTLTQSIYVYSKGFPTGSFTYYQSNDTVYFLGDSVADNFNWDFGDTGTSVLKNPAHAYAATGDYTVAHVVNNYCGLGINSRVIHVFPPAGVPSQAGTDLSLHIYPNPFGEKTTLRIPGFHFTAAEVKILDVFGREIFTETINSPGPHTIHKGNLPNGIYFIRVLREGEMIGSSKLIIQ